MDSHKRETQLKFRIHAAKSIDEAICTAEGENHREAHMTRSSSKIKAQI